LGVNKTSLLNSTGANYNLTGRVCGLRVVPPPAPPLPGASDSVYLHLHAISIIGDIPGQYQQVKSTEYRSNWGLTLDMANGHESSLTYKLRVRVSIIRHE
jgi:hypothetical protein